jgi:hypothetical protein
MAAPVTYVFHSGSYPIIHAGSGSKPSHPVSLQLPFSHLLEPPPHPPSPFTPILGCHMVDGQCRNELIHICYRDYYGMPPPPPTSHIPSPPPPPSPFPPPNLPTSTCLMFEGHCQRMNKDHTCANPIHPWVIERRYRSRLPQRRSEQRDHENGPAHSDGVTFGQDSALTSGANTVEDNPSKMTGTADLGDTASRKTSGSRSAFDVLYDVVLSVLPKMPQGELSRFRKLLNGFEQTANCSHGLEHPPERSAPESLAKSMRSFPFDICRNF